MRLLFAEDEPDLNRIVTKRLTEEGYSVDACDNGEDALYCLTQTDYDGAILDIMMPKLDGLSVLAAMQKKGRNIPVLFLTARDSIEDRVAGLDAGAEDYLVKPFSFEELLARVRVLTRSRAVQKGTVLRVGDLSLDVAAHTARLGDADLALSAKDFSILEYLMRNPEQALSREQIEDHIWNYDYEGGTNLVDVYMSRLRKKLGDGKSGPQIRTIRGVGYMLTEKGGSA